MPVDESFGSGVLATGAMRPYAPLPVPRLAASTVLLNQGRDTLVTLGDGSTILFKGIAYLADATFIA